ncbi:MAG TPA: regulator of amino acid metabolism, contains ACT domain protein [Methanofollis liminatans]|uniref:Regulator of amino acid metabolism, contains ACT domain protein n=1 Tax=Methanofollis liminatans TaxID=2201 RepID=A0A831PT32_9EURY|nr:regulator of amino acid metabolism, contains ACT domain protein [Methanofollis liminatans]
MYILADMWATLMREFSDSPAQSRVVRFLLENGFGVSPEGKITCNGIEIPATHIARAIGIDRRVVDATARRITSMEETGDIFARMRATPDLSEVAGYLNLTVITIIPNDAQQKGIVGAAVRVLSRHDLAIRQIFVTDPYFAEEPRLVIILDESLPTGVLEELRALPQVKQLII